MCERSFKMAWNIKIKLWYWDFLGYGLPLFAWHACQHRPPPCLNYMGTRELPKLTGVIANGFQITLKHVKVVRLTIKMKSFYRLFDGLLVLDWVLVISANGRFLGPR
jgi:hypothetical protein